MLLLDSAAEAAGLTLYADHADGAMFHYLPGAPRVVSQAGSPGVTLLRYRGTGQGGFLTLDVDLTVAAPVLAAARAELTRRIGREARLVPVLFREGSVRVTALAVEAGSSFLVENILATATPSLLGHGRAIFSVELSAEGATLISGALEGEELPVIVAYDLAFEGLRPARGLRAHVEYRMAYDFMRARLQPNVLFFKADLDRESEALQREGHITIEDVDYTGSDPALLAQRAAEARTTVRELTESLFFQPAASPAAVAATLPAGSAVGAAWGQSGRMQAAFSFRQLAQEESTTLEYDYREARVATWRVAPQGALRRPAGITVAAVVRDVTLGDIPSRLPVRVFSLPDADWTGIASIEVEVRASDGTPAFCVLTPAAPEHQALLDARSAIEWRARILANDDPAALGSASREHTPFQRLGGRVLQIDPARLAGRRVVTLALGRLDPGAGLRVSGRLRSDDATREFLLDAAHPELKVPIWKGARVRAEWTFETAGASAPQRTRDLPPGETALVFNAPPDLFQTLTVVLQNPLARLESALVEVETPAETERRSFLLNAAAPRAQWTTQRGAPDKPYRYRLTTVGKNGQVEETTWRDHVGALLVVGDTHVRVQPIEVMLAGVPDSLGAVVKVTSLAPPAGIVAAIETILDPGILLLRVQLPLRPDEPTRYRVEGQVFLESGERPFGPLEDSSEVIVVGVGTD
jgi:hypothetical protein